MFLEIEGQGSGVGLERGNGGGGALDGDRVSSSGPNLTSEIGSKWESRGREGRGLVGGRRRE